MAPTSRPDSFELADYLGVLRRRWWIVLLLVVVGAGAGAAYTKVAPKTYTGAVLVQVTPLPNNANAVAGRTGGNVNMDNEAQIIQSVKVATLAAQQFAGTLSPPELAKRISVSVPANTTFLQVKCSESAAATAAECANAFGRAYLTNRRTTAANGLNSELASQTRRIALLATRIAGLKTQLAALPVTSTGHVKAQLSLTAAQNLLSQLQGDSNKLVPFLSNLNAPNNTAVGQIATPATAPTSPSSPRALLLLPSGVLAGLLLGLLAAFLIDFRDRRIHAARDVERFLDLPVLVNLSVGKSRVQAALAPPRSRAGQAFTELSQYVAASLGDGSHVVFVAGTSVGPGCSVLAANLAATLARTRSEVVLVCADPHGTVTPQLLGVSDGRGLAEVLAGSATVGEVARRPADERRLRVITPGIDTSGVLLHLQYEASRRLLGELRSEARYVIVEVQSVGEDSDAFALAEFADAAIMAVETSLTTRAGAADCLQRLDRLRTSVLGAVVLPAPSNKSARTTARLQMGTQPVEHAAPRPPRTAAPRPRPIVQDSRTGAQEPRSSEERRRPSDTAGSQPAAGGKGRSGSSKPRSASGAYPSGEKSAAAAPAGPSAPRTLNETRPMPRVTASTPPEEFDEPIAYPPPADKIAGG
jgi:succinoglycan biosynthesis transport protein ExoP